MLGREALIVLAQMNRTMAERRGTPFARTGVGNGRTAIAVVRSYSRMIRGARLPSPLRDREPDWDPESGIRLAG